MSGSKFKVKPLFLGILILVLGLGLAGPASAQVKELVIGIGIDADTLNPQEQTTTLPQNMCDLIYDSLLYQDPEGKLHPRLAEKYDVSADGLTYTLKIRKGIKFSDGTPLDADAVKLTWDRILDPKMRVPLRFAVGMVEQVTKVDDQTVTIKLKYPFAPFAPSLSMSLCSPISPAAIEKHGEDVRQHPVGAGPYVLSEWVKGDRIVMVRNENYWGEKPTVEKIVWKIVPDALNRENMLRAGQIQICYKPLPSDVAALKADSKITVEMPLDTRTIFMGLNCQKGLMTDKLVRQAFNYAVDKKAICDKVLFGTAEPMDGPVSPKVFGHFKMDKQYEYNPEKAKELLKKANWDFSKTVTMRTPNGRYLFDKQVSETVQGYLQDIGIKTKLSTFDWPTYVAGLLKPLDKTELEVFLLGWGPLGSGRRHGALRPVHLRGQPAQGAGSGLLLQPGVRQAHEVLPGGAGRGQTGRPSQAGLGDGLG
jgi:ABC-type transport system substrate-binding protein